MGYFLPHMYRDTYDLIINCKACQIHAPVNRSLHRNIIPIHAAWPFCKWGIDIVGPFPRGVGNVKFLVVAINYFTKWVKAKPLSTITGRKILTFVWEDIVCCFGLPRKIVSENGTQFAHNPFKDCYEDMDIQQSFTSVAYPQANGQVKVTNRDIVAGIKSRLVYGTEAVIPAEVLVPTNRITTFDEQQNDEALRENLDALEERQTIAHIRQAEKKQKIANHYEKKFKPLDFQLNNLVLRSNEASRQKDVRNLGPRWEDLTGLSA
ncbi:uncharacterized protein [Rutidosis leptorrhynchoides]|uniref:uncharacterized protein n=1 Tax=Rutidosis leptorrhynchoides TaxID=125765 RepID=UPI003A997493